MPAPTHQPLQCGKTGGLGRKAGFEKSGPAGVTGGDMTGGGLVSGENGVRGGVAPGVADGVDVALAKSSERCESDR